MINKHHNNQAGYTLVEIAVVMLIAGIIIVASILLLKPYVGSSRLETTRIKQENVSKALASFAQTYGRLPCPADPAPATEPFGYPRNSGPQGKAFATNTRCGVTTANYTGILPFSVLGLTDEQAKDSYGNYMTYTVEPAMTNYNTSDPSTTKFQTSCTTTQWMDANNKNKNPNKAHVCCPLKDEIDNALGSINVTKTPDTTSPSMSSTGPATDTDETVTTQETINVTIIPASISQSGQIKESAKGSGGTSVFQAPANAVLTGRWHSGDENGNTMYQYGYLQAVDDQGNVIDPSIGKPTVENIQWEGSHKESQATYIARGNTVIVGRQHSGDENGQTSYLTGYVKFNGQTVNPSNVQQSGSIKESSGTWYLAPKQASMVLRIHSGDENGQTTYQSALFKTTAQVTKSVTYHHHADGTTTQDPPVITPGGSNTVITAPVTAPTPNHMVAFMLVSHGQNGDGAFMKGSSVRKAASVNSPSEKVNYTSYNGGMHIVDGNYSTTNDTNYFDDIVLWKNNDQLMSQFGKNSCSGPQ